MAAKRVNGQATKRLRWEGIDDKALRGTVWDRYDACLAATAVLVCG